MFKFPVYGKFIFALKKSALISLSFAVFLLPNGVLAQVMDATTTAIVNTQINSTPVAAPVKSTNTVISNNILPALQVGFVSLPSTISVDQVIALRVNRPADVVRVQVSNGVKVVDLFARPVINQGAIYQIYETLLSVQNLEGGMYKVVAYATQGVERAASMQMSINIVKPLPLVSPVLNKPIATTTQFVPVIDSNVTKPTIEPITQLISPTQPLAAPVVIATPTPPMVPFIYASSTPIAPIVKIIATNTNLLPPITTIDRRVIPLATTTTDLITKPLPPIFVPTSSNVLPKPVSALMPKPHNTAFDMVKSLAPKPSPVAQNILAAGRPDIAPLPNIKPIALKALVVNTKKELPVVNPVGNEVKQECVASNIYSQFECEKYLFSNKINRFAQDVKDKKLSSFCLDLDIHSLQACSQYYFENFGARECRDKGLNYKSECSSYLRNTYGDDAFCSTGSTEDCIGYMYKFVLADFVSAKNSVNLEKQAKALSGRSINIESTSVSGPVVNEIFQKSLKEARMQSGDYSEVVNNLSFKHVNNKLNLTFLATTNNNAERGLLNVAVVIDTDHDGLSDDVELIIGTSPFNPDTDGDGYPDKTELVNNKNPLSAATKNGLNIDPAIRPMINQISIQQPKMMAKDSSYLAVSKVISMASTTMKLNGRAKPNSIVNIFVYSTMPIILTVKTDDQGNWVYNLDKSLVDGRHEAYVVVNDDKGQVVEQSAPFSFFVKEAKAVTRDEFVALDPTTSDYDLVSQMKRWYMIGGGALAGLGFILFYVSNGIKRNKLSEEYDN